MHPAKQLNFIHLSSKKTSYATAGNGDVLLFGARVLVVQITRKWHASQLISEGWGKGSATTQILKGQCLPIQTINYVTAVPYPPGSAFAHGSAGINLHVAGEGEVMSWPCLGSMRHC